MSSSSIPSADFAIISGSAGWGFKFPEDVEEPGVSVVERGLSFDTPFGRTDNWQVLELAGSVTEDGKSRIVLNVFAHGWAVDVINHPVTQCLGWVLREAGAKKVLADSTCGSLDRAIWPGDFVIPADLIDLTQTLYSSQDGRFSFLLRGGGMICPAMAEVLEREAEAIWPAPGRIHGYNRELVVAHAWGPRLETPAEGRALRHLGGDIANSSIATDATAAREAGACFVAATYVANYGVGVLAGELGEPRDDMHHLCGPPSLRISLRTIMRVSLDAVCPCSGYRKSHIPTLNVLEGVGDQSDG